MSTWLIGAGYMAQEYAKVLNILVSDYDVIGRGEKSAKEFESKITMSTEMTRQKALIDSIALPGGDWTLFAIFAFSACVILQELVERVGG